LRVLKLKDKYQDYRTKGLRIVAVFQSPIDSLDKYVRPLDLPFPVVADPQQKIYALYQARASWWGMIQSLWQFSVINETLKAGLKPGKWEGTYSRLPSDFLIGSNLMIKKAFYARDITQHMPFEDIDAFLMTS